MKKATTNYYQQSINTVIDYINNNLNNGVDAKAVAAAANISEFHFYRIFKAHIGESLGAYVLRLRLENVAQDLYYLLAGTGYC